MNHIHNACHDPSNNPVVSSQLYRQGLDILVKGLSLLSHRILIQSPGRQLLSPLENGGTKTQRVSYADEKSECEFESRSCLINAHILDC